VELIYAARAGFAGSNVLGESKHAKFNSTLAAVGLRSHDLGRRLGVNFSRLCRLGCDVRKPRQDSKIYGGYPFLLDRLHLQGVAFGRSGPEATVRDKAEK